MKAGADADVTFQPFEVKVPTPVGDLACVIEEGHVQTKGVRYPAELNAHQKAVETAESVVVKGAQRPAASQGRQQEIRDQIVFILCGLHSAAHREYPSLPQEWDVLNHVSVEPLKAVDATVIVLVVMKGNLVQPAFTAVVLRLPPVNTSR